MNIKFLTIRTFFENKDTTEEYISKTFVVDIAKVYKAIEEAINDGLLNKNNDKIVVTDKGKEYLSKYKVDKAVILACGLGKRLGELTKDLPKCFLFINGERLIERQIGQLKEAGIDDITIMVGYLSDEFKYLVEKYNVKLLYNEEYDIKNNLATLYKAKDILKDSNVYICTSDVYIKDNIYHKFECDNYYTGNYQHDLSNEWQMIYDDDNKITNVLIGGDKDDYIMVGPAFFNKEFVKNFMPMIDKAYHTDGTDNYYWENILVENLDQLPDMYIYKLPPKTIYEFDKIEDIDNFNNDWNIKA